MQTEHESGKATVRRALEESFDETNPAALEDLCTPDLVHHTALREDVTGREAFVEFAAGLHDAFDDLRFDIHSIVAEDDTVAVRGSVSGVHAGEFQGIEPTGKAVTWKSDVFARIEDGRLAETWVVSDMLGLLKQLDAVPAT